MAQRQLIFRSAISPPLGAGLVCALVGYCIGSAAGGGPASWLDAMLGLVVLVLAILALVVVAVMLFRVFVREDGLRSYTRWGIPRTLRWPEIDSVRPFSFGLRYLRVTSSHRGVTVWVPLFLADMKGLRAAVRDFAGEGHILSRELARGA